MRDEWPVLEERSDEELAEAWEAYVLEPAKLSDVLLKTPVGPVFLINIIIYAVQRSDYCGGLVKCVDLQIP